MTGVKQALLQDLDGLNKVELTSHDWWGGAIDDASYEQLARADRALLDTVAKLTLNADDRFAELRSFYAEAPRGRAVIARLRHARRSENSSRASLY